MRDVQTSESATLKRPGATVRQCVALAVATLLVLSLGALEDWFGTNSTGDLYGSDAVQYMDCARAMARGDWRSALNPLWSQGYPALIALARPVFPVGAWGDWYAVRVVNGVIFALCWTAFCWLVWHLLRTRLGRGLSGRPLRLALGGAVAIFLTTQLTIGQASRVGPDELVATLFFAVSACVLWLLERPTLRAAALLGLLSGIGFLVKAAFLPLGLLVLVSWAVALMSRDGLRITKHAGPLLVAAAGLFGAIVLSYGAALSHAAGHRTLGESGSLNYAWHVDRLAKWVHWEGGADPAAKAWPSPALARFAQWQADPPDFGRPVHPSLTVGARPTLYVFHAPVHATYVPYFDPPYWYEGYRHVFRWRYQAIALAKGVGDLTEVLDRQPLVYTLGVAVLLLAWRRQTYRDAVKLLWSVWPVVLPALGAVALFIPVHLEGRYVSGALAVLAEVTLLAVCSARTTSLRGGQFALCIALLLLGTVGGLMRARRDVIGRVRHGWSPARERAWIAGETVARAGLAPGSEVGMISWEPALACDWAYVGRVEITSEIADGVDEQVFWALAPAGQAEVLERFRHAGARAVLTWDRPSAGSAGWRQLPGVAMWMYPL